MAWSDAARAASAAARQAKAHGRVQVGQHMSVTRTHMAVALRQARKQTRFMLKQPHHMSFGYRNVVARRYAAQAVRGGKVR